MYLVKLSPELQNANLTLTLTLVTVAAAVIPWTSPLITLVSDGRGSGCWRSTFGTARPLAMQHWAMSLSVSGPGVSV